MVMQETAEPRTVETKLFEILNVMTDIKKEWKIYENTTKIRMVRRHYYWLNN